VRRKNIVGLRIKEARKEVHMSQAALAAQMQLMGLKVDRSMIAKVENGFRPISDMEIMAIAKILRKDVGWLFQESS